MIRISTLKQLVLLSRALISGQPTLRLFPRCLRIRIGTEAVAARPTADSIIVHTEIRNVLLAVRNLIELVLDVPSSITLKLLNDCPPESMKFRLKHFSYALNSRNYSELLKFLSCQSRLEELVCIDLEARHSFPHPEVAPAESSLLPQLKSLTAGAEIILRVVPGRPVSKIHIEEWIYPQIASSVISAISRTTVPLVHLSI
ncbi:hypothetical protein FRC12_018092 [Ceratobasidium sp. 428]|nr:hypothetical protein FRC12_018092 [Ceratobasidium sp. 428]